MPVAGVLAFLAVKLLAYTAWCWVGLGVLAAPRPGSRIRRAGVLALLRLALGFALGWLLLFGLTAVAPEQNRLGLSLPALLVGFVFLRWLEWSFIGALAAGRASQWRAVLLGTGPREHLWRVGGLAVSFATDLATFFGVGALGLMPC
jgi:hypothetical protein